MQVAPVMPNFRSRRTKGGILPVFLFLAAAFLAGCASLRPTGAGREAFVTVHAKVVAFDPDGVVFDLVRSTRAFRPGTVARGPLSKVEVTEPGALAGREYTVLLPEGPAAAADPHRKALMAKGTTVVFGLPEALQTLEPRQIIDFMDLTWPRPPAKPVPVARLSSP